LYLLKHRSRLHESDSFTEKIALACTRATILVKYAQQGSFLNSRFAAKTIDPGTCLAVLGCAWARLARRPLGGN